MKTLSKLFTLVTCFLFSCSDTGERIDSLISLFVVTGAAKTVFSVSDDFWCKAQTWIVSENSSTEWSRGLHSDIEVKVCEAICNHMRRSSLGSGRGRPGFSHPAAPVCFLSSALGLYVPSILLFFLMTHSSSSRVKLSRDNTVETNAGTVHCVNSCITIMTDTWRGNHTQVTLSQGSVKVGFNMNLNYWG